MAGNGEVEIYLTKPWYLAALLYDFEIDSSVLRQAHRDFLRTKGLSYYLYSSSMVAHMIGLTSRTGSDQHNAGLSVRRATAVDQFLRMLDKHWRGSRPLTHHKVARGEEAAKIAGHADGHEDRRFRAVFLQIWDTTRGPVPDPPDPPKIPKKYKRRVYVAYILTEGTYGIPSLDEPSVERRAEASRQLLQTNSNLTPLAEKQEEFHGTWGVTHVKLERSKKDVKLGDRVGHVTEYLHVRYTWGPTYWNTRVVLSLDGVTTRTLDGYEDQREIRDWVEKPLMMYRRGYATERPK